jgi:hypothetical protein
VSRVLSRVGRPPICDPRWQQVHKSPAPKWVQLLELAQQWRLAAVTHSESDMTIHLPTLASALAITAVIGAGVLWGVRFLLS